MESICSFGNEEITLEPTLYFNRQWWGGETRPSTWLQALTYVGERRCWRCRRIQAFSVSMSNRDATMRGRLSRWLEMLLLRRTKVTVSHQSVFQCFLYFYRFSPSTKLDSSTRLLVRCSRAIGEPSRDKERKKRETESLAYPVCRVIH